MKEFDFPTNIKQIGTIDSGLKIYIEDYVSSYLIQYATAAGYDERLATLVGRYMYIDQNPVIFINGAILGKYTEEDSGILKFTRRSMEYIEEQIDIHFKGMEIVGLMQSQPGYGTFLNPAYKSYYHQNFNKQYQVMFIIDPLEKVNSFYTNRNGNLQESNGYFIYYEKNNSMHDYMMENKIIKPLKNVNIKDENESPYIQEAQIWGKEEKPLRFKEIKQDEKNYLNDEYEEPKGKKVVNIDEAKNRSRKPVPKNQRRVINMLLSMSSVLLLISFVMAAALIRSEDRIARLEVDLGILTNAYVNIIQSLQLTQEAFATQNVIVTEDGMSSSVNNTVQNWPQTANLPQTYVVQAGDNLLAISQRFYGTTGMVGEIMRANNLSDPDMIFHGMILLLPSVN
ncbi:MAG: LysM peptidoglycan-binding domain-containing protein [Defluviitaleaceae bacterium]|nr:LysM peptidoglycan-binding domain-containing protein [Defluviitaleaceae bacterium]